jgi:hypothetical protein
MEKPPALQPKFLDFSKYFDGFMENRRRRPVADSVENWLKKTLCNLHASATNALDPVS